jgi:hypothetical protein
MNQPDYTCECDIHVDNTRALYHVTDHAGKRTVCSYCQDCALLADRDWNGTTAAIESAEITLTPEFSDSDTAPASYWLGSWQHNDAAQTAIWHVLRTGQPSSFETPCGLVSVS